MKLLVSLMLVFGAALAQTYDTASGIVCGNSLDELNAKLFRVTSRKVGSYLTVVDGKEVYLKKSKYFSVSAPTAIDSRLCVSISTKKN